MWLEYSESSDYGNYWLTTWLHLLWRSVFRWGTLGPVCKEQRKFKIRRSLHRWVLRKRAAYVRVHVLLIRELNHEDDIVFGLECGDDGAVARLVSHRFAVDGSDNCALAKANLIGKGTGANVGDDDAAFNAGLCCEGGGEGRDGDAELALTRV